MIGQGSVSKSLFWGDEAETVIGPGGGALPILFNAIADAGLTNHFPVSNAGLILIR